jgi:hypothetical protein
LAMISVNPWPPQRRIFSDALAPRPRMRTKAALTHFPEH